MNVDRKVRHNVKPTAQVRRCPRCHTYPRIRYISYSDFHYTVEDTGKTLADVYHNIPPVDFTDGYEFHCKCGCILNGADVKDIAAMWNALCDNEESKLRKFDLERKHREDMEKFWGNE